MKRWNGWGDDSVDYPLPEGALQFLVDRVGLAMRPVDARLHDVAARVPASRVPETTGLSTQAEDRVRHARGQSLPDWVALRSGRISTCPDAIARPSRADDVRGLIDLATRTGAALIPYGGGTSVVGHINP
ncbi:MAG TPA: hypothetical protein PLI95_18250, partial [Polyangiaceae bacterium]|nr:hypothetical protein [Polyangiaceae bacterium]